MPTYAYECTQCGERFEQWSSIHSEPLTTHDTCGGNVLKILGPVRTHGVGPHGARTRTVDATEAEWARDMPAYKRLRREGHTLESIDGAAKLEATAKHEFEIRYGPDAGKFNEREIRDRMDMSREIVEGRA